MVHLSISRQVPDLAGRGLDRRPAHVDSSWALSVTRCVDTEHGLDSEPQHSHLQKGNATLALF